ncbi:hypothetical protein [uncultured Shewanella sp.]|nr:hypothetical protein [uncultured Shewanella sp.]
MKRTRFNHFAARRRSLRKNRLNKPLNRRKQFFALSKYEQASQLFSLKSA